MTDSELRDKVRRANGGMAPNALMRVIYEYADQLKPKFKIGQQVWHDHSGNGGVVREINMNDPKGYCYFVEFTVDFGVTRSDWYQAHVLKGEM